MKEIIALIIVFLAPASIAVLRNFLWDIYFWQVKEYRWDRFWTHVRWDQEEELRDFFSIAVKFILFACVSLFVNLPIVAFIGIGGAFLLWTFQSFEFLKDLLNKNLRKPALKSPRNLLILLLTFLTLTGAVTLITYPFTKISTELREVDEGQTVIYDEESTAEYFESNLVTDLDSNKTIIYPDIYILISLLTLFALLVDLGSPLIIPIFVFLTVPLAWFRRNFTIYFAQRKLANMQKRPIIIGITGSQGKTTTKEILYEILKDNYKVAKTPENYNTAYGVGWAILNMIKKDTEIFIAEMGAYRKNELKSMTRAFKNDISVITDIDTQHVGLFGSQLKLAEAKAEIIKELAPSGLAILNGDNYHCRKYFHNQRSRTVFVSSKSENKKLLKSFKKAKLQNIFASKIKHNNDTLKFEVETENDKFTINTKLHGEHLVDLILISIAAAREVGMSNEEIKKKLNKLDMEMPRLSLETGDNETLILDDSYNTSRKGFIAAVKLMNKFKKEQKLNNRIFVTRGILELGREKKNIYKNLAQELADEIDILITSDMMLADAFMHENIKLRIIKVKKPELMLYEIRKNSDKKDIILLEGRLNPIIIQAIVSDTR